MEWEFSGQQRQQKRTKWGSHAGILLLSSAPASVPPPSVSSTALPHFFPVLRLHRLGSPKDNVTASVTHGVDAAWAVTGLSWGSNA